MEAAVYEGHYLLDHVVFVAPDGRGVDVLAAGEGGEAVGKDYYGMGRASAVEVLEALGHVGLPGVDVEHLHAPAGEAREAVEDGIAAGVAGIVVGREEHWEVAGDGAA